MTEEERKKLLQEFLKPIQDEDEITDQWTEEEILEAAKRIMRRLGIEGELQ